MPEQVTRPLGEIADLVRGITFKPTDLLESGNENGVACFRTKNIQAALDDRDLIYVPRTFIKSAPQYVTKGDTLISTANSHNLVGKVCWVPQLDYTATLGGFISLIRARPGLALPKYLYYWLSADSTQERLRRLARQTTNISNLPLTDVAKELVPVPPLDDQERIVKLLDEADALRKLRAEADRRMGELVPALFYEMFGKQYPFDFVSINQTARRLSAGWAYVQLTDVARLATGHTPSRRVKEYWNGDIPWLSLSDIRQLDGGVALDSEHHVTPEGIANSSAVLLPPRTVCFSRTASVGFVTMLQRSMATSQDFVNWIYSDAVSPTFLMWALIASRKSLRALSSGSTHKTIYFPTVERFHIVLPPIAQQRQFSDEVRSVRSVQEQLSHARPRTDQLMASILHSLMQN